MLIALKTVLICCSVLAGIAPTLGGPERPNGAGCRSNDHGPWSVDVYFGPSPFELVPLEQRIPRMDTAVAWPASNPVVTCSSHTDAGGKTTPFSLAQRLCANGAAEPSLLAHDGRLYMFYSSTINNGKRGGIIVAVSSDGGATFKDEGIVMNHVGHVWHPFVFTYMNQTYMIPQTSSASRSSRGSSSGSKGSDDAEGAGQLALYRSTDFPKGWVKEQAVAVDRPVARASIVEWGGRWWMFAHRSRLRREKKHLRGELDVLYADTPLGPWRGVAAFGSEAQQQQRRGGAGLLGRKTPLALSASTCSAGRPFVHQGRLYRVARGCSAPLDRQLLFFRVTLLNTSHYEELPVVVPIGPVAKFRRQRHFAVKRLLHMDAIQLPDGSWMAAVEVSRHATGLATRFGLNTAFGRVLVIFSVVAVALLLLIIIRISCRGRTPVLSAVRRLVAAVRWRLASHAAAELEKAKEHHHHRPIGAAKATSPKPQDTPSVLHHGATSPKPHVGERHLHHSGGSGQGFDGGHGATSPRPHAGGGGGHLHHGGHGFGKGHAWAPFRTWGRRAAGTVGEFLVWFALAVCFGTAVVVGTFFYGVYRQKWHVILFATWLVVMFGGTPDPVPLAGQYSKFTLMVMSYDMRLMFVRGFVAHYSRCPSVSDIVIVWNKGTPPDVSGWDSMVPLRVRVEANNSMNNRYRADPLITNRGVLSLDDDLYLPCPDIERAFGMWRANPERITGFYPRVLEGKPPRYTCKKCERHAVLAGRYNVILAGAAFIDRDNVFDTYWSPDAAATAARAMVDETLNCDDLLLNYLMARKLAGRQYVQYVRPTKRYDVGKLSMKRISAENSDFCTNRHRCIDVFNQLFGPVMHEGYELEWGGLGKPYCESVLGCIY